ncbi:fibronectin type III domain-containing protein, partial [Flavobacteriales bacterium]|nr:fibronectin type III domain-containing protein [Flavobacteriales bacterium]
KWAFINILWIPIKLVARLLYYYIILFIWDIYKSTFNSLKGSYNKQKFMIGFKGAIQSLTIVGLGVYFSIISGLEFISMIGLILCFLPILNSFGKVTSLIHTGAININDGKRVVSASVNFIIISVLAILFTQILISLSFIPDFGLVILGISISTNVLLSFITLVSLLILCFAVSIFPTYLLKNNLENSLFNSTESLLKQIRDKGLQILVSIIPASLFSVILLFVPVLLIHVSMSSAESFKNEMYAEKKLKLSEEITEFNSEVEHALYSFNEESLDSIQSIYEQAIRFELKEQQLSFADDYPHNLIDNPYLICDTHLTNYTNSLPILFEKHQSDSVRLVDRYQIEVERLSKLQQRLQEFKSQDWSFTLQRRKSKNDGEWKNIGNTDIRRFVDKDIDENQTYEYRIKSQNTNGESSWSMKIEKKIGNTKVRKPSQLRVSNELNFRNIISWNDNSNNETGFIIERKIEDGDWSNLTSTTSDVSIYIDSNIQTPNLYSYRVKSFNEDGFSEYSNTESLKTTLGSPYSLNSWSNVHSSIVDWSYNFGYNENGWSYIDRKSGNVKPNIKKGNLAIQEISFSQELEKEIAEAKKRVENSSLEIDFNNRILNMYNNLIEYDESKRSSLYVFKNLTFILMILFIAIFGGIILAIMISFLSKVFYNIYPMHEDKEWYFLSVINEEFQKDKNQPLLGLSVFVIFSIEMILRYNDSSLIMFIQNLI